MIPKGVVFFRCRFLVCDRVFRAKLAPVKKKKKKKTWQLFFRSSLSRFSFFSPFVLRSSRLLLVIFVFIFKLGFSFFQFSFPLIVFRVSVSFFATYCLSFISVFVLQEGKARQSNRVPIFNFRSSA